MKKTATYTTIEINKIVPYSRNARTHSQEQIAQIISSIQKFGFTNPILIDRKNNLIAGHGRISAAIEIGMTEIPAMIVHDLTPQARRALVLADNKIAMNAGWDEELLKSELFELKELGEDLNDMGFSDEEFDDFFPPDNSGNTDDDQIPELPATPVSQLTDVWLLGNHRLMCGDSTSAENVTTLLNGHAPNTMITDPPYGVKYEADWRAKAKGVAKTERETSSNLQNDNRSDWFEAWELFKGDVAYVWHASAFTDIVKTSLEKAGFEIKAQIIWNKNVHALSRSDYHWKHEPCWYAVRKGGDRTWLGGRKQMTVWDIQNVMFEGQKTSHPTQKPIEIYTRALNNHTVAGEYVYEPFGGSGSAIIACEKIDRNSLTMELDPKYVDVIIMRWQEFTGKQATHSATGLTFLETSEQRIGTVEDQ